MLSFYAKACLERNIVVHVAVAAAAGCNRTTRRVAHRAAGAEIAARLLAKTPASAAATAVKHGEVGAEALQNHLCGILLDAALVGPFAGLERAFDVNLRAFLQVLLGNLGEPLIENHDAVPFGLFLALS